MDYEHFKREMAKAKTFIELHQNADYWQGYQRGLRRVFLGEAFGTKEEHQKWLSLIADPYRVELGRGYRDGLEGKSHEFI
jgi:hypothetical protein